MNSKKQYLLYQTFSQDVKSRDITPQEKEHIIDTIPSLTLVEKEAIFLLIYEHERLRKIKKEEKIDLYNLPYGIKKINPERHTDGPECEDNNLIEDGVEINLQKLPARLRQILLKFINVICKSSDDQTII